MSKWMHEWVWMGQQTGLLQSLRFKDGGYVGWWMGLHIYGCCTSGDLLQISMSLRQQSDSKCSVHRRLTAPHKYTVAEFHASKTSARAFWVKNW